MQYTDKDLRHFQGTLAEPIHFVGDAKLNHRRVSVSLLPAPVGSGIHFLRRDVDIERALVTATWRDVVNTHPTTKLSNRHGIGVRGAEPLLAALRICGIDNLLIELNAGDLPPLGDSNGTLLSMIRQAGVIAQDLPRWGLWMDDYIEVRFGEHFAYIKPGPEPRLSVELQSRQVSNHPLLVSTLLQDYEIEREIEPVFCADINLLGENWIDITARFRILESIGILELAESPIFGQIYIYNPCPFIVNALVEELFARPDAWRRLSYPEIYEMHLDSDDDGHGEGLVGGYSQRPANLKSH